MPTSNLQSTGKYDNGLAEIEKLKTRAKEIKPKKRSFNYLKSVVVTFILFFLLFISGFYFSYTKTKRNLEIESAKFTPKAQIKLPATSEKCLANISATDVENKNSVETRCSSAGTRSECEIIDQYNETDLKDLSSDGKPDCKWLP